MAKNEFEKMDRNTLFVNMVSNRNQVVKHSGLTLRLLELEGKSAKEIFAFATSLKAELENEYNDMKAIFVELI